MEQDKLIYKLNEFYALEVYQLDLYASQLKSIEEPHIKRAYERLVMREQEHVDLFKNMLRDLGREPSAVTGSTFAVAGIVTGKALDLLSLKERYKIGIIVENKAVDMYKTFIKMAGSDPGLTDLAKSLWYQMIDEEMHQYYFKEHLTRLLANE